MKIGFFTENHYKGGLDTFIVNLVNSWPDYDDELILLVNDSHPGISAIKNRVTRPLEVLTYHRFYSTFFSVNDKFRVSGWLTIYQLFMTLIFRFFQNILIFPWYVTTLAIYFKKSNFDRLMVINGGYPASILCRSAIISWGLAGKEKPGVMNFHSLVSKPAGRFSFTANLIDNLVIKYSTCIVGVSKACIMSLSVRHAFLSNTKLNFIYNGIKDPVRSSVAKRFLGQSFCSNEDPYCLMLSTYHSYKGHDYLLDAFSEVIKFYPKVSLRIFGHGSFEEKKRVIEAVRIRQLETKVYVGDFMGEISALLSKAAILVVPSQGYESFGLTIIEAMAYGVPVVATNVGGIPEVMDSNNAGYVCSKDSHYEFAEAIVRILGNPCLAKELGGNGRLAFEERFTAERMAIEYKKILS